MMQEIRQAHQMLRYGISFLNSTSKTEVYDQFYFLFHHFLYIQSISIEIMGNCTGTNSKSKPIKSLQKQNIQDQENTPPSGTHNIPNAKITLQEAIRKRDVLKRSLMEGSLDPPVFFVHKIEPLSKKYNK